MGFDRQFQTSINALIINNILSNNSNKVPRSAQKTVSLLVSVFFTCSNVGRNFLRISFLPTDIGLSLALLFFVVKSFKSKTDNGKQSNQTANRQRS